MISISSPLSNFPSLDFQKKNVEKSHLCKFDSHIFQLPRATNSPQLVVISDMLTEKSDDSSMMNIVLSKKHEGLGLYVYVSR